ncbi:helix-turn-helix domain-containing protein [Marinoscillum pacificum]|uniref:helix-turn-helix domain-containing protein n=1 Tax=Marinoscillum pacificum TaxID=392723 RepID=UPI002158233A|nr:helix-turn-helix domain-containing protein [Marinoscillum pacificum]
MIEQRQLGDRIIQLRMTAGLTQDELAEKCQVATRTIQRIELNQVNPRAYTLRVLSEVLNEDLFEKSHVIQRDQRNLFWYLCDLFNFKTNKMKKISILSTTTLSIFLAIFLMSGKSTDFSTMTSHSIAPKSGITIIRNQENEIEALDVVFSSNQTLDSLILMRDQLIKWNITLNFSNLEFDDSGNLTAIGYSASDGRSKGAANAIINKQVQMGFYFDYTKSRKRDFCIGGCWIEGQQ